MSDERTAPDDDVAERAAGEHAAAASDASVTRGSDERAPADEAAPADASEASAAAPQAGDAEHAAAHAEATDVDDAADVEATDVDLATDVTASDREAAANEAAERARTIESRTLGLWGLRVAAGVATIAIGVVAVVVGPALPSVQADPRIASVAPDAPEETRTCAGPLLAIGDASGDAEAIRVLAQPQVRADADAETPLSIAGTDAQTTVLRGATVAGAQWLSVADDSAFGAAASECGEPATSQWLVGGSTTTGRSSVLTIANPGTTATSVDVAIFGEDGRIDAVGSTGIAIGAGAVVLLDLASLAPGVATPVVQVTSSGGPIAANLQHRVVRTLQPGGVDVIDPAQASTSIAIPGVVVGEPTALQAQEGFADAVPALRLLAAESTRATITTIVAGGDPIASTLDLVGGTVSEVDLSSLAPGTYAFTIDADVPVVAAARQMRVDGGAVDLDWVRGQSERIDGVVTAAIAAGPSPTLHLLNVGDEQQVVTVGGVTRVELAPDELVSVPVGADTTTTIEGSDVIAAITYAGGEGIGGHAVSPRVAVRAGVAVEL